MAKNILILGTGGNSIDILDTLREINRARGERLYERIGFLDDDTERWGETVLDVPILGGLGLASEPDYADFSLINGIGSPSSYPKKRQILERTGAARERFETVVHPSASVSTLADLGRGVVILQNVTIASRASIGDQVIVLPNSVISHDDQIGELTCIAGGVCISGDVEVGENCYLGSNATLKEGIRIGPRSLVGMSSVVLHDVAADSVVAGNPAHVLRRR